MKQSWGGIPFHESLYFFYLSEHLKKFALLAVPAQAIFTCLQILAWKLTSPYLPVSDSVFLGVTLCHDSPICPRPPRKQCHQFSSEHWSQSRTSLAQTEHQLFPQPSQMAFIVQKGLNDHLCRMLLSSHVDYVKPLGKRPFSIRLIMLKKEVQAL